MGDFKVGQKVYVVLSNSRYSRPYHATITKIGRKWAYVEGEWKSQRFDLETMWLDGNGYTTPGRIWLSQEEYERETHLDVIWRELQRRIPYVRPKSLKEDGIDTIARLLDIPLPLRKGRCDEH